MKGEKNRKNQYRGSNTTGNVAWFSENSNNTTHPVGTKSSNELGIHDMSGNVWEWCSDWYDNYSNSAQNDPRGPSSGSVYVIRGGGWINGAGGVRASEREGYTPAYRGNDLGFRLACSSK